MISMVLQARRRLEEHRTALERCLERTSEDASDATRELAETLAAIERIEAGTYGRCEQCNGAIGRQRLLALPAARYCIACALVARGS